MARRRRWPLNADDHRIAAAQRFQAIRDIVDDLKAQKEVDPQTLALAIAYITAHCADGLNFLTQARFGLLLEEEL